MHLEQVRDHVPLPAVAGKGVEGQEVVDKPIVNEKVGVLDDEPEVAVGLTLSKQKRYDCSRMRTLHDVHSSLRTPVIGGAPRG